MLLLQYRPIFNGRGYRVLSLSQNYQRRMDGLAYMAKVECRCDLCKLGVGPGDDFYDVNEEGIAFPHISGWEDSPANIKID